jgi:uncharacterized RDD family membrane protein YckC
MESAHLQGEHEPVSGAASSRVAAGVPDRIAAGLIDLLILAGLFVATAAAFGGFRKQTQTNLLNPHEHVSSWGVSLTGGAFVVYVLLCLAYYFVLESRNGQTVGKRALGLRVVTTSGARPTRGAIALRTVFRLIDILPFFYIVGLIAIGAGDKRQRIGDRVADTTVARA